MKPKMIRVEHFPKVTNLTGEKTLSVDYMGHRFIYDKLHDVIYWKQLQPAIVGWGFTLSEN